MQIKVYNCSKGTALQLAAPVSRYRYVRLHAFQITFGVLYERGEDENGAGECPHYD